MKFKLTESYGYTYIPDDPALEGYDLELDFLEIYDLLKNNFSIEEIAQILANYGYLTDDDVSGAYDMEDVVFTGLLDMNIYDLLGIYDFRELLDDYISEKEKQLLDDIKDAKWFRATHGPEL